MQLLPLNDGQVVKSSFHGYYRLGTQEVELEHSKPREARDLISKIRSCTVRSDLKNKAFSAVFSLFLRSDLTVQDRILEIRSLASMGSRRFVAIKTVQMAQKSGFVCHKSRSLYSIKVCSYTIFSVKVPLFQRIFTPYDPSLMAYFGRSVFFANMGGRCDQNWFQC